MTEQSAADYWSRYGASCWDAGRKAVLTTCTLVSPSGRQRPCVCLACHALIVSAARSRSRFGGTITAFRCVPRLIRGSARLVRVTSALACSSALDICQFAIIGNFLETKPLPTSS